LLENTHLSFCFFHFATAVAKGKSSRKGLRLICIKTFNLSDDSLFLADTLMLFCTLKPLSTVAVCKGAMTATIASFVKFGKQPGWFAVRRFQQGFTSL
jgi:hypothetical protein